MNLKTFILVFFSFVLLATLATGQTNPYNKLDKLKVNDLIAQKLEVQSTTKGAIPCPSMTQTQRNAIPTPLEASCVFNQDSNSLNVYDGSGWVEVGAGGGGGGINNWETAYFYDIGDVVIESNKIYQCNTAHTSSVFATDIAKWTKLVAPISLTTEVSGVLPMANGGSEKALTPVLGGVVYTDGGSMEVLAAGTSGQLLKSNGAAAPEWMTLSVNDATFSGVLSLGKGGTNKNLTASNGAIAYSDADSIELLAPGTSGQVLQSNGVAAPSYVNKSISAKAENASSVTLEEIQVSNNQLTQTDANKQKIETGNKNILVNPSFEHSTFSTGWTSGAGSFSQNLTVEIDGLKAAEVTLSAQALAVTQDSTLYAAQFADGIQGLASVRVKTLLSGIRVCSRQAGVTSTTNCVNVQGNGKWGLYKVPMILGATSNGISIASNGTSLTGTVYIDDAFVGPADLTQNMNACNDVSCETEFSAKISSTGVVSGENLDWINTVTLSGTNNNRKTINFKSGIFTASPNCTIVSESPTCEVASCVQVNSIFSISSSSLVTVGANNPDTIYTAQNIQITCQKQGADFTAAKQLSNGNTYSSTNADTDWASCTPTSSQGFGTPTFAVQCKRQGGDLLMKGRFTPSTTTAVEARLGLPLWNGTQLVSAGSSIIPALEVANGFYLRGVAANAKGGAMLIEPSVAYLTFGTADTFNSSLVNSFSKANANNVASTETLSFNARIPIESWQQSNLIIAELSGLQSCTNTLECTDTFSAKISSAGVVSDENVSDFLNGNCSVSPVGTYTCNFGTSVFSVAPNCTATAGGGTSGVIARFSTQTNTQYVINLKNNSDVAATENFNLICQKQGADYIGKTAKAVASDQNVRSIGAVGVDMQSVYFAGSTLSTACSTSPCVIYRQVGSKITSVSRVAIGQYNLNGIDGTKYQCTGTAYSNAGTNRVAMLFDSSASSSTQATISSQGVDTSYNSIICIGIP
jgi:hypothetical protein